ncbi:hypothetical protein GGR57DRAFT_519594 [Xylariaceae sp. FL1272]|nr:hypothetical protein GGR57DRAFT_519594 [Xylariaceae sp. FL1272]
MSSQSIDPDLFQIPLAMNPNGNPLNFDGGLSLQSAFLGTGVTFISVSFPVLVIRLYAVFKSSKRLYPEDCLCAIGELCAITYWATIYAIHSEAGVFMHSWDIPVTTYTPFIAKTDLAEQVFSAAAHFLVKCSIILFYIRMFSVLNWVRVVCYGLLVFTPPFYILYVSISVGYCIPGPDRAYKRHLHPFTNLSPAPRGTAG